MVTKDLEDTRVRARQSVDHESCAMSPIRPHPGLSEAELCIVKQALVLSHSLL